MASEVQPINAVGDRQDPAQARLGGVLLLTRAPVMFEENMSEISASSKENIGDLNNTLELYKLIIDENRHLHQVWIDNFKIILTFNSILLAGAFALLTILNKEGGSSSNALAFSWSLRAISLIGTIVTLVGIHIIRRTKAITSLRLNEIRYVEETLHKSGITVFPFEEGALVLGNSTKETFIKNIKSYPYPVVALKFNPFSGLGGYFLIGASFILSYIVIFILSML